jgi:hypothetical protein
MPSLILIKPLGYAKFASHMLKMPPAADWRQPAGNPAAPQYGDAIVPPEKVAIPKVFPPYFMPQNMHKHHQNSSNDIGQKAKDFQDKMLDAVKFAHDMWRLQAGFTGLQVMAVSAIGTPGCLTGPTLESFIKMFPACVAMIGNEGKYRDAVAKGVSTCFQMWQSTVTVPGLPWYPAFAAFPGPMAPPMPNVPVPLITCASAQVSQITVSESIKGMILANFDPGLAQKDSSMLHLALFDAIATVLSVAFLQWLAMQQVNLVMGMGPIPTFAPPFVPVGPVVGGSTLPGVHLIA